MLGRQLKLYAGHVVGLLGIWFDPGASHFSWFYQCQIYISNLDVYLFVQKTYPQEKSCPYDHTKKRRCTP